MGLTPIVGVYARADVCRVFHHSCQFKERPLGKIVRNGVAPILTALDTYIASLRKFFQDLVS